MPPSPARPLPIAGAPPAPRERADAARNRARALAAAERLFADRGVAGLTMDDIATEAGVGKGTLYRRFSDKGGLAAELLSERGAKLQQDILAGPPPLGPGAAARERLAAFVRRYLEFQSAHLDLVLLSETSTPGGRLRKPSYLFWRQHIRMLLREAGATDAMLRAEVLLSAMSAEQVGHWTRAEGRVLDDLADGLVRAATALSAPREPG